jgi:hypothetical protein
VHLDRPGFAPSEVGPTSEPTPLLICRYMTYE